MRDFLYFLMSEDNRFYYEHNGTVSITSLPTPLQYTPDGWLDIAIQRQRSSKYFGLDRSFTVPLNFVKDGGLIVKNHYYNNGIEDKLFLAIADKRLYMDIQPQFITDEQGSQITDQNGEPLISELMGEYGFYYSLLYKGEIDFSQFDHEGPKVTLNIMEGGAVKLLKANESTTYDIPMSDTILVKLDGIKLQQKAVYIVTNGAASGGDLIDDHIIALTFITQEAISSLGAINEDRFKVDSGNTADMWNTGEYFLLTGAQATAIVLNWNFQLTPTYQDIGNPDDGTELHLEFHAISSDSVHPISQVLQIKGGGDWRDLYGDVQTFAGSATINVPAKCRCILYMSISKNSNKTILNYNAETSSFNVGYTYTHPASYIKAVRPLTLFKQLAAKMGINKVSSAILKQYENVVVTCGDAIRGLAGAVIKTSMSDFYNSFNTVLSVGMAVSNNTLQLERKSYFVNYSAPIDLGECKNLKVSPATDYIVNTIKIGYPEQDYDDVNGKQEFNNTHIYTTPVTRLSKELNLVSVYRADSYGVEFSRINLEGKITTDSASDNDVFLLHIKAEPEPIPLHVVSIEHYELNRVLNLYTSGIPEPGTVFNIWLSPKHCLLRNGQYIRSCFYKMDNQWIKFQTTQKNSTLKIVEPGQKTIVQNADVEIGSLGDAFFTANLFEFDNKVPADILELFKSNPLRSYQFTNDGITYIGLPQKDSVKPGNDQSQSFQLLSAPSNDLKNLIDYNG